MSRAVLDNYQQMQIATANPAELLILTYEIGLKSMRQADRAFKKGESTKARSELLRAVTAVVQLDEVLDVDAAPVGPHLRRLYGYVRQRLLYAAQAEDVNAIKECIDIMSGLLDAWRQAAAEMKA